MQCVYAVRGSKNTLFSTYCTLLFLLYAPPFWKVPVFTKLIVLRSEVCSDWPAIQCVVPRRINITLWPFLNMPSCLVLCSCGLVKHHQSSPKFCSIQSSHLAKYSSNPRKSCANLRQPGIPECISHQSASVNCGGENPQNFTCKILPLLCHEMQF